MSEVPLKRSERWIVLSSHARATDSRRFVYRLFKPFQRETRSVPNPQAAILSVNMGTCISVGMGPGKCSQVDVFTRLK